MISTFTGHAKMSGWSSSYGELACTPMEFWHRCSEYWTEHTLLNASVSVASWLRINEFWFFLMELSVNDPLEISSTKWEGLSPA